MIWQHERQRDHARTDVDIDDAPRRIRFARRQRCCDVLEARASVSRHRCHGKKEDHTERRRAGCVRIRSRQRRWRLPTRLDLRKHDVGLHGGPVIAVKPGDVMTTLGANGFERPDSAVAFMHFKSGSCFLVIAVQDNMVFGLGCSSRLGHAFAWVPAQTLFTLEAYRWHFLRSAGIMQ